MNKFIKFADLPPNPMDREALADYKALGFNVCLLTEDDVDLVENGKISENYCNAIRNIEDMGLEVWIRNMFNDEDYFECDEDKKGSNYGYLYEMEKRHITSEFSEFEGVTGFYMADEAYMYTLPERMTLSWMKPDPHLFSSFDKLTKLVDWKNTYYPDKFWHMNHVPGQSWDHYMPQDGKYYDYHDFLTAYADVILRRLKGCGRSLCLDNYPFIGKDYLESDYLYDLMTAADVTRRYNNSVSEENKAVFGICVQTFFAHAITDARSRDITLPEEVTLQLYAGMALGARLFEYFCYGTYEEIRGMIDAKGNKRIYDIVKTANETAEGMQILLSDYEQRGAFAVCGNVCTENVDAFIKAHKYFYQEDSIFVESEYDVLVGYFEKDGKKAYLIVNYTDPIREHVSKVSIRMENLDGYCIYQSGRTQELSCEDDKGEFVLKPGDAVFLY